MSSTLVIVFPAAIDSPTGTGPPPGPGFEAAPRIEAAVLTAIQALAIPSPVTTSWSSYDPDTLAPWAGDLAGVDVFLNALVVAFADSLPPDLQAAVDAAVTPAVAALMVPADPQYRAYPQIVWG